LAAGYTLELTLGKGVRGLKVRADHLLTDMLAEIMRNSMVHSASSRGSVIAKARRMGKKLVISLEDRSGGMDKERMTSSPHRLRKLLETGNYHGSGIGLSMVYEICGRYRWDLSLEDYLEGTERIGLRVNLTIRDGGV